MIAVLFPSSYPEPGFRLTHYGPEHSKRHENAFKL